MKRIVKKMVYGFVAISISIIAVTTITYINMSSLISRESRNSHSLKILRISEEVYKNMLDIETGMRGYLIVGDTSFLKPYHIGESGIKENSDSLFHYAQFDSAVVLNVIELNKYNTLFLEVAEKLISDEYYNRTDTILRKELLYKTKRYMNGIRNIVNEIEQYERKQLLEINNENVKKAQLTKIGYLSTAILSILILIIVYFIVRRQLYKRAESELKLRESLKEISDLYNNAPCGYHSVNDKNLIISINDTELNWLGYAREEVINKLTIFDIIHEKDHYKIQSFIEQVNRAEVNGLKDLELCFLKKDGTTIDVLFNNTLFFDEKTKSLTTRTVIVDITELKLSQEKINSLYEEIDLKNKILTVANQDLESFTYSVSHDLRAPLRAIDGYCKIILEDYGAILDKEALRIFNIIMNNSIRMGNLIDDLLDFARLGKKEINLIACNHNKIIEEVILEMNIDPKYEVKVDDLIISNVDRNLFKHVWSNLLSNSVKYSSTKLKPIIHIYSYKVDDTVVYCIEDNGVGFEEKYKHKLFYVFQRLHSDEEFEGTGVGLAIVEKIISKHNGNVWADSELDKITKFYFSIPC